MMKRRTFQWGLVAGLYGLMDTHAAMSSPIQSLDRIKRLRIGQGPLADGFSVAPGGWLNWYFVNLGLIAIVQYLQPDDLDHYIRRYLDLYLSRLEPDATIRDVQFADATMQNMVLVPSDSDDSYAATLLSLALRYLQASGNRAWWLDNQSRLRTLAEANIVSQTKPNGLCRVFQLQRSSLVSEHAFTMNNCEDYRGLRDFSVLLQLQGHSAEATHYKRHAHRLGLSIARHLWDRDSGGYRVSDQDQRADPHSFYPGMACQVFPQAMGVLECSPQHGAAYRFLNSRARHWPLGVDDPFAWCILGHVAALRGDTRRARQQLVTTEALYGQQPERVTINELGFDLRIRSLLNGRPEI